MTLLPLHENRLAVFGATAHNGAQDMPLSSKFFLGPVGHVEVEGCFERKLVLFPHMSLVAIVLSDHMAFMTSILINCPPHS